MQIINHSSESKREILKSLIDTHQNGYSLEREFYTSSTIYNADIVNVWGKNWIWVGHTSQLTKPGDYFVFDFGTESVIVVSDSQGTIRAHLNVCRHRGSRICIEKTGNARLFTCPYHAWSYDLKGALLSGRLMPDTFNPSEYGLHPVSVINYHGLIFICLCATPPDLQSALQRFSSLLEPFELSGMKVAHQATYPVPANWKLALENYLECYHCAPSHQHYSKSHTLKDPAAITPEMVSSLNARSIDAGLSAVEFNESAAAATQLGADLYYRRYPLFPNYVTGSESGEPLAPLLGHLKKYDGGASDIQIGALNWFLAYSDHVVGYRFIPRDRQSTDIQTVWMVRSDAKEGIDYDLNQLTWLWHLTTQDDERIIRHNQQGVNSLSYAPGPLSTMEWGITEFYSSYLKMLDQDI